MDVADKAPNYAQACAVKEDAHAMREQNATGGAPTGEAEPLHVALRSHDLSTSELNVFIELAASIGPTVGVLDHTPRRATHRNRQVVGG